MPQAHTPLPPPTPRVATPTLYVWGTDDSTVGRRAAEWTREYVSGRYQFVEITAPERIVYRPLRPPEARGAPLPTYVATLTFEALGNDTVFTVIATTSPSSPATVDLVKRLRDNVIPGATGKGIVAFVGGSTASNVDLAAEISNRLPLVIITILLLSMLVLLVAFRSVLIPLQAAATNFVTAMAAFGILTACFQWGWGINIVGVSTDASNVPIASYVPLMMFAILFGLSMDYQVFLLSSVDHHRLHGEDDRTSVRLGLKTSARVISAAALIMISVFSSFILNGDPVVKQFGVGLSTAVLLAATMVLMLAPAVLTLLGRWAWWMPAWLGRVVPTVDIEGTSLGGDTEPAPVAPPPPEPA